MAKTAMIRARIEPELKEEVESLLKRLGLSATEAINIFYKQVRYHRGLPFEVRIPNRETVRTMKRTDSGKGLTRYSSVDALMRDLKK